VSSPARLAFGSPRRAPGASAGRGVPAWVPVTALMAMSLIGLIVGVWAYVFPRGFYDLFPTVVGNWIHQDGPYNQHLIRDVGAMYLALGLAGLGGLVGRSAQALRVLGLAWTAFGLLHFSYHLTHLHGMTPSDAIGNGVGLGLCLVLGVAIVLPIQREKEATQ
jgi:hypothetical protein